MKHDMAMTKELNQFVRSVEDLTNRPHGTEGCGLLWGEPGTGKTTATAWVANQYDAVFVRALGCWTVTSMLGALCTELGSHRMCRRSDMVEYICKNLAEKPRPIFIDEADYLFRQEDMMDSIRDIYDISGAPVILIGMEEIARKIQQHGRFARRITQWIEFKGLDLSDTALVAARCCECVVGEDLLEFLHRESRGNIGRVIIGLARIETMAKTNRLASVGLAAWGTRQLFYDQPTFGKGRKRGDA